MTRLCPVCGNNHVTKPQLGMCNVCFAQEHGGRVGMAQQSAENKAIHQTILRRMQMKRDTAEGLRQVASRATGDLRVLLLRAAIIADDGDPLLFEAGSDLEQMDKGVQRMKAETQQELVQQPERVQAVLADAPLLIVHGGAE